MIRTKQFVLGIVLCAGSTSWGSVITNGDFETGNLNGWTTFVTSNGTLGSGHPLVANFDTNGDGSASNSAIFQVGQIDHVTDMLAGGGIFQNVEITTSCSLSIHADIASATVLDTTNMAGGLFELLIDGNLVTSHDFGSVAGFSTERATLDALVALDAGSHDIRFQVTRPYLSGTNLTPLQYIDNIMAECQHLPEPMSGLVWSIMGLVGMVAGSRRTRSRA